MKTFVLVFAACGLASAGAPEGKATFAAKCAPCHGPNGEGRPAIAKMFGVEMHPLSSQYVQSKSDAEIKQTVANGKGKMKPVAGLADKQVEDVIAYVRTLKE